MRIAVTGPQNTGKTTFLKDFLKVNKNYITPKETYRDIVIKNNLKINQKTNENSQKLIRDFLFKEIKNNKETNIIFDRCVIDNYVYSYAQYQKGLIKEDFILETKDYMLKSLRYIDVYFFIPTSVGVKIKNDKLRDTDLRYIDKINKIFLEILFELKEKRKIKIKVISGDRKERVKEAINYLNDF